MKDRVNVHLGNYTAMRYDATSKGFALCGTWKIASPYSKNLICVKKRSCIIVFSYSITIK